jgi:hypothetical protein
MRDASICGLGQTAASAVQSALQKFPLDSLGPRLATPAGPAKTPEAH